MMGDGGYDVRQVEVYLDVQPSMGVMEPEMEMKNGLSTCSGSGPQLKGLVTPLILLEIVFLLLKSNKTSYYRSHQCTIMPLPVSPSNTTGILRK